MSKSSFQDNDPTASERKADHIQLAFRSRVITQEIDRRFDYEPMVCGHPSEALNLGIEFGQKKLKVPIWVSSMTGGTKMARTINRNLAMACSEFGMGMGLGSCRSLLTSNEYLEDFAVRNYIGDQSPLYANLGIAQIQALIQSNKLHLVNELIDKLEADGLIIHVNPLQEWLQPEGDVIKFNPIDTIKRVLDLNNLQVAVKEVGQGFGPKSMEALLDLPLVAIEFAASGGTNFALLELLRGDPTCKMIFEPLAKVGHDAESMVDAVNVLAHNREKIPLFIISGGIQDFLHGYYLIQKCAFPAIYGQASKFLEFAQSDYSKLQEFVRLQVKGLELAYQFLRIKKQ